MKVCEKIRDTVTTLLVPLRFTLLFTERIGGEKGTRKGKDKEERGYRIKRRS